MASTLAFMSTEYFLLFPGGFEMRCTASEKLQTLLAAPRFLSLLLSLGGNDFLCVLTICLLKKSHMIFFS